MGRRTLIVVALIVTSFALWGARPSVAFDFVPNHLYTTSYSSRTILQHDETGALVASLEIPPAEADELKGLAFGPDGLLYVTAVRDLGFEVLALDETGVVHARYPGNVYVRGNLSFGKLDLDEQYLYVAGQDWLTRFELGNPNSATPIYSENQVFDVEIMESGNLLVLSAYRLAEITPQGELVREIGPPFPESLGDARGVECDEVTGKIFVTQLGYTNFYFRLMRLDGATGELEDNVVFRYADDLFLTSTGDLLVGSRTDPPRLYDQALQQIGELEGGERMFVTQYAMADSTLEVAIDVKPGSDPNTIACNDDHGTLIPVAILTTDTFDATTVDHTTVAFEGAAEVHVHPGTGEILHDEKDVDGDGDIDADFHFILGETALTCESTEAVLTGETFDGLAIEGVDSVRMVYAFRGRRCGLGYELALLVPLLWLRRRQHRSA